MRVVRDCDMRNWPAERKGVVMEEFLRERPRSFVCDGFWEAWGQDSILVMLALRELGLD